MKLLLIDDDKETLEYLAEILNTIGFITRQFSDPKRAVETYKEEHFDVVVTDIKMPIMSGIKVLEEIRAYNPKACVILVTGFAELDVAIKAVNNGAFAFFKKPLKSEQLLKTLMQVEEKLRREHQDESALVGLIDAYAEIEKDFESLLSRPKELSGENISD